MQKQKSLQKTLSDYDPGSMPVHPVEIALPERVMNISFFLVPKEFFSGKNKKTGLLSGKTGVLFKQTETRRSGESAYQTRGDL